MQLTKVFWVLIPIVAGGACGGSSERNPPVDPESLIVEACDAIAGLQCAGGPTAAECTTQLHQQRASDAAKGCAAQFDAVVACIAKKTSTCAQSMEDICGPEIDAAQLCEAPDGGDECSQGYGGALPGAPTYYQQCMISCATWGVSCETVDSPTVVCTCTEGPKAGTTFTPPSCTQLSISVGAQYCAG